MYDSMPYLSRVMPVDTSSSAYFPVIDEIIIAHRVCSDVLSSIIFHVLCTKLGAKTKHAHRMTL